MAYTQQTQLSAIDFFCGGGGMTHGLLQSGINVIAGIDLDSKCRETYEVNNKPARFIEADVKTFEPEALETGVTVGEGETETTITVKKDDDDMIFIGCSPCQFWSLMHTDKTKSQQSKNLLADFQKFVDYFNPGYVVIENVPGLASAENSPLTAFINFLREKGYLYTPNGVLKVYEHGVPQTRRRFVLIASRVKEVYLPEAIEDESLTVSNFIRTEKFTEISAGHKDETEFCHTTAGLSSVNIKRLELTPALLHE